MNPQAMTKIIEKAYSLLTKPGVKIDHAEALDILGQHGAKVDLTKQMVSISMDLVDRALKSVPKIVDLYDQPGNRAVTLGRDETSFVAGGSAPFILDFETNRPRPVHTMDLIRFLRLSDSLPFLQHTNPSLIPADIPAKIKSAFRCFLSLLNTSKPLCLGMSESGLIRLLMDMLVVISGSEAKVREKPRLSFACCPRSPLCWDELASQNLIDCAKLGLPVRIIPAPISGATAPVTLVGTIVQHTAENLCGVVIHQLVQPGASLIYGTAATTMDMRNGTSLFGSFESQMTNVANCQIGKHLGIPTYAIVSMSDAKVIDAQAGFESISGTMLGILGGADIIVGAGMLESGMCQSFEKLVIDNELCGMGLRLAGGLACEDDAFADDLIREVAPNGNFLATAHTLAWSKKELFYPSPVVDRSSRESFQAEGGKDASQKAREVVCKTFKEYEPLPLPEKERNGLVQIMMAQAKKYGVNQLPDYDI
ncbi:MAG: trimethylamine methyltransferase family protein [Deltaproteobacteria bacterium]|nr:trimethylamine methyltransferase family protein [Deltaproteobacteria bacterium]